MRGGEVLYRRAEILEYLIVPRISFAYFLDYETCIVFLVVFRVAPDAFGVQKHIDAAICILLQMRERLNPECQIFTGSVGWRSGGRGVLCLAIFRELDVVLRIGSGLVGFLGHCIVEKLGRIL